MPVDLQTVIFGEISGICKTRIQQQQTAAAEFGTFLLKTAMGAYGPQNSGSETSLAPESSFSLNHYVQSLRPAHLRFTYCTIRRTLKSEFWDPEFLHGC